jgi:hypothetical protein
MVHDGDVAAADVAQGCVNILVQCNAGFVSPPAALANPALKCSRMSYRLLLT